jgi:hypothetical protein
MKNIKILRALLVVFLTGNILSILLSLYMELQLLPPHTDGGSFLNFINITKSLIKEILLLPSLIFLFQAVQYFIKMGYFNMGSAIKFKMAGILLMINSVVGYIVSIGLGRYAIHALDMEHEHPINWLGGLPTLFILFLAGFGLYTLSDFIRKGEAIERENELTI